MDTITDLEKKDQIQFADGLFPDSKAVLEASEQVGANVVIWMMNNKVTLLGVNLNTLQSRTS